MTPPLHFIAETARIGMGTKIWHYSIILDGVDIGEDCSIGSRVEIGNGSVIGDRSRISSGVFLPSRSTIGERVFIGPNTTFTDDRKPKVRTEAEARYKAEPPVVEHDANIGAGCVILPGVLIGHHALVGAGSVVSQDVPPYAVVRGDPAKLRYVQPEAASA